MTEKCGEFLKALRIKEGLSQIDIARALGYQTVQYISDWERAKYRVPLDKIKPLAKLLKISTKELLYKCYPEIKDMIEN